MLWIFANFAHGAGIIKINISESITVTDTATPLLAKMINVSETVGVADSIGAQSSIWLDLSEPVGVSESANIDVYPVVDISIGETITASDSITAFPAVMINVSEAISVADTITPLLSAWINIAEPVAVSDLVDASPIPVVQINISETVVLTDAVTALPAVMINVSESVGVADSIGTQPSAWIEVSEPVAVSDTATVDVYPVININITESVAVADTVTPLPSAWIDIAEPVTVSDTVDVSPLPVVQIDIAETIAVDDTVTALPAVMINVSESVGVADSIGTQPSAWVEISESIAVNDAVNLEALNIFAPTASAGGPYSGTEGQSITLDGSASTDRDGSIVLYEWDIDNDGTYDYNSSSPTQSHTYSSQNNYLVRLRVIDSQGFTDEAVIFAEIVDSIPTADFSGSPTSGTPPLTVDFINNSTGYDQPLSYEWDFDNNGTVDSTLMNPSYSYSLGIYSVKLKVTDFDGSTNSLLRTNHIRSCLSPVRIAGVTPVYFFTLQSAYNAANDGQTIQSRDETFIENININRNITLTFIGGFNCDFTASINKTTIIGNVNINNGKVTIENFNVQK